MQLIGIKFEKWDFSDGGLAECSFYGAPKTNEVLRRFPNLLLTVCKSLICAFGLILVNLLASDGANHEMTKGGPQMLADIALVALLVALLR